MLKRVLYISVLLNVFGLFLGLYAIHKLGGLSYILFKMKNRGVAGVYEHRKDLFKQLPKQMGKIIFLGDSITEACEWGELLGNPNVINRGIAGDVTEGILRRLSPILETQPQELFLMVGVNDLIQKTPTQIAVNYKKILERIQLASPQTIIHIQSVLPVNNQVRNTSIKNENIRTLNREIKQLALSFGVDYIDLHSVLRDADGNLDKKYTSDGIHLNGKAYLKWKELLNL